MYNSRRKVYRNQFSGAMHPPKDAKQRLPILRKQSQNSFGHASLSEHEQKILSWSRERRLEEFQKINSGIDQQTLENKLFYIDTITVDSGEIIDILRLSPGLSWEKVRDIFLGGPVDGQTSTFHGLEGIVYPEHFWKAIIENEREKL